MRWTIQSTQDILNRIASKIALCVKITRTDGTVFAFTTHDKNLTFSSTLYCPGFSMEDMDHQQTRDGTALNTDAFILIASSITETDLRAGRFDGATVNVFEVLDTNLGNASPTTNLLSGFIGEVETQGAKWRAELRGHADAIQQPITKLTSINCRTDLGSSQCTVNLTPDAWAASTVASAVVTGDAGAGTVVKPTTYNGLWAEATIAGTGGASEPTWPTVAGSTVTDGGITWTMIDALEKQGTVINQSGNISFTASGITDAAGRFDYGLVTWVSAVNNFGSMEVREQKGNGLFTLFEAMPLEIVPGDTFTVTVGCQKRLIEDCKNKFNNIKNFDGEPFLPGAFGAGEYPDAR
jgi:uncharacterized phage protein (TIGR02218 family)